MALFLDSFWRAVASCLHPRVIALSFLPLAIMAALSLGIGYFFWDAGVGWMSAQLSSLDWLRSFGGWLDRMGAGSLNTVVAPAAMAVAVTPLVVVGSLLVVALLMAPALVSMVGRKRFPQLERKQGGSLLAGVLWSLGSTLLALLALVVSLPLWLLPPLVLFVPPLIWGWLTYRVMTFDALAEHASRNERRELVRRHRPWLLAMGVVTGYLGAAPSIVWASAVVFAAAFVVLIPVAVWIYTLVFAFSALWFAHYSLAALEKLREEANALPVPGRDADGAAPAPVALRHVQPPSP